MKLYCSWLRGGDWGWSGYHCSRLPGHRRSLGSHNLRRTKDWG
ncbi:hypothetical protein [Infirmifilum sp. NZ]|nr:hypothetical protein [Infirmifilum sp. NZ]